MPRHLVHDAFQHRKAVHEIVLILPGKLRVDHRERVDAEARRHGELDEGAALQLGRVLERATVVDNDDLRAGTNHRGAQLLQSDGLARARLAAHRDIVIAGGVLERRPEERLSTAANQHKVRLEAAQILALQRHEARCGGGQHRPHALHVLEVERQPVRHSHRHGSEQALDLQIAIVEQVPACGAVHRLQRSLVRVTLALRAERGNREEGLHELAALAQLVLDELPLGRLILQLRQHARRLGVRKARGPHELATGALPLGLRIREVETQVGRHGAGHAQLVGEHVADELGHIPRRPTLRQVAHRERAHVEGVGVDLADLGCIIDRLARWAEPFGPEQDPIGLDLHLKIVPYRLIGDGIERIVGDRVVTRCRRR